MKYRLRIQPKLVRLTAIITLAAAAVAGISYVLFGQNAVSLAMMTLFIGLTMLSLLPQEKGVIALMCLAAITAAALGRGSVIAVTVAVAAAVGVVVLADRWSAGAAKLLPGAVAYVGINSAGESSAILILAATFGFAAALLILYLLRIKGGPAKTGESQKVLAVAVFAVLAALFTVISLLNDWRHGYWMVLTLCSVLQLREVPTRKRMWEQLGGTIGGAVLAVFVVELLPSVLALTAAVVLGVGAIYANLSAARHIAAATTTAGLIILLSQLSSGAATGIAGERIEFIAASLSIIALVSWLLWRIESQTLRRFP